MNYKVEMTEEALDMLAEIQDKRIRGKLFERITKLSDEPEKQGKPLVDELHGYRSVRAIGQRYRIIYEVKDAAIVVLVIGVGIRKEGQKKIDIYQRMKKMISG